VWDAINALLSMRMSPRLISTYVARSLITERVILDAVQKYVIFNLTAIVSGSTQGKNYARQH
jgi:hypothetical protein